TPPNINSVSGHTSGRVFLRKESVTLCSNSSFSSSYAGRLDFLTLRVKPKKSSSSNGLSNLVKFREDRIGGTFAGGSAPKRVLDKSKRSAI
ncbi:hypothetical protein F441_19494, partial [Phytophthora nicotianae CJ01A1]